MALPVLETPRLLLHEITADDAPFMLALLNDPDFHRYIGDRGVRDLDAARAYIESGPRAMYARHGFGLWRVDLREDGTPIGICGLLKRDALPDVDVGFAFLPGYRRQGYAHEAAEASLRHGQATLRLARIVAIVAPGNTASARLLQRLGLAYEGLVCLPGSEEQVELYSTGGDKGVPGTTPGDPAHVHAVEVE